MTLDLVLVGFGHVARRFVRLLREQRAALAHADIRCRFVGVATARHGCLLGAAPLDADVLLAAVECGAGLPDGRSAERLSNAGALLDRLAAIPSGTPRIVIETTPLDVRGGQPAVDYIERAFAAGAHVITANKGPVAFAYASLSAMAGDARRLFRFEGVVMDGIPVFSLVRETLPAVTITGFSGVLNSTTNFALDEMARGRTLDEALDTMRAAGIAEADPSLDVDGWDSAAKAAALMNVLMAADTTPLAIARQGIAGVTPERVTAAVEAGRRLKLVARAHRTGNAVVGTVGVEEVERASPLGLLDGQANALVLETDLLGSLTITQGAADLTMTAYALLADLFDIVRHVRRDRVPSSTAVTDHA